MVELIFENLLYSLSLLSNNTPCEGRLTGLRCLHDFRHPKNIAFQTGGIIM